MKKLPRLPMRPEQEPGADSEVWKPTWKCFCCHDYGIVRSHLAEIVIDSYDFNRDKLPRCQNHGCSAGSHYDSSAFAGCIDYRLNPAICQELDAIEREAWRQTLFQWHRTRKCQQINFSKVVHNLRGTDRTSSEQMEAMRRSQEVMTRIEQGLNYAEHQEMLLRTGEINDL